MSLVQRVESRVVPINARQEIVRSTSSSKSSRWGWLAKFICCRCCCQKSNHNTRMMEVSCSEQVPEEKTNRITRLSVEALPGKADRSIQVAAAPVYSYEEQMIQKVRTVFQFLRVRIAERINIDAMRLYHSSVPIAVDRAYDIVKSVRLRIMEKSSFFSDSDGDGLNEDLAFSIRSRCFIVRLNRMCQLLANGMLYLYRLGDRRSNDFMVSFANNMPLSLMNDEERSKSLQIRSGSVMEIASDSLGAFHYKVEAILAVVAFVNSNFDAITKDNALEGVSALWDMLRRFLPYVHPRFRSARVNTRKVSRWLTYDCDEVQLRKFVLLCRQELEIIRQLVVNDGMGGIIINTLNETLKGLKLLLRHVNVDMKLVAFRLKEVKSLAKKLENISSLGEATIWFPRKWPFYMDDIFEEGQLAIGIGEDSESFVVPSDIRLFNEKLILNGLRNRYIIVNDEYWVTTPSAESIVRAVELEGPVPIKMRKREYEFLVIKNRIAEYICCLTEMHEELAKTKERLVEKWIKDFTVLADLLEE